jgi:hypothetical protein
MAYNTDIERLNYYEGEFLGAADFEAEQEYQRDMRRRHNIGQHTWGIVGGLDIAQIPNGVTTPVTEVDAYIQPGMAVDGFGREIVVLSKTQLTLDLFAPFYNPQVGAAPQNFNVWISYAEAMLNPPTDACTAANTPNAFGRVQETFALSITQSNVDPTDDSIVVDSTTMSVPIPPSSYPPPSPQPGVIVLPYDDSVPYQEFETDDSNLSWYIFLGQVSYDPNNQVLVPIAPAAAAAGRQFVGSVASILYAPAAALTIKDRFTPSPLPSGSNGVAVTVEGWLNVVTDALIGGWAGSKDPGALSPLTIVAGASIGDLIQFRDGTGHATWDICKTPSTATPKGGLNFGEIVTPPGTLPGTSRLFIQSGGNVGIGTTTPAASLDVASGLLHVGGGTASAGTSPGAYVGWSALPGNIGETDLINNQGSGSGGGIAFMNAPVAGTPLTTLMMITGSGSLGIGTTTPAANLDVATGLLHVGGTTTPVVKAQGAYLGWNALTGGTGETDFINNQGLGTGGFAFMNTPPSGTPRSTLMVITGSGSVGIGTLNPQQNLSVNAGLNIDQANKNPGGTVAPGLTFGFSSGEGIASNRIGGPNLFGLDFYTDFLPRMSINNAGSVGIATSTPAHTLDVNGTAAFSGVVTTSIDLLVGNNLTVNGARTYLIGQDGASNHWIMGGGTTEGKNNAIALSYNSGSNKGTITVGNNWTLHATQKVGYLADRFLNRSKHKLERGDVVVLHADAGSHRSGLDSRVPLPEVDLTTKAHDPRVCGIVDDPLADQTLVNDLDPGKLGNATVGVMVTVGAYSYCKVDAETEAISPGDLLTTSSTPGHAQKFSAHEPVRPGAIIGKALGSLKKGKGIIPILVAHQ